MFYKILLTNSDKKALLDAEVYEKLQSFIYVKEFNILQRLRLHSRGYVFFQRGMANANGKFSVETIYLHNLIGRFFLEDKPADVSDYKVVFLNGNKLDCRLRNLKWAHKSEVARYRQKTPNKTGYRGVCKDGKKYRAVLYNKGKRYNLGLYPTAREAAKAYNKKSLELFGDTGSLNKI